jgi:hypothetical protein
MNAQGSDSRTSHLRQRILAAAGCVACTIGLSARAADLNVDLVASQTQFDRLGPDVLSETAAFPVDQATLIRVEVTSTLDNLTTSIVGPGGQVLTPGTVASFGGEYSGFSGDPADSFLIIPSSQPGAHYVYSFPSLGTGTYTVHFSVGPGLAESVPVITELLTDSPVVTSLFPTESSVPAGFPVVLVASVLEGSTPVSGATVTVAVKPPTSSEFPLSLHDDGTGADGLAGDGIYSGSFTATEVGDYNAVAQISGINSTSTPFTRLSGARFSVVPARANLTGTLTDQGVDDNGNTLFDRVVVSAQVQVTVAGTYELHVTLRTPGGQNLQSQGTAALATGTQMIGASFGAPAFLAAGEDGPYTIKQAELVYVGALGVEPSDWITEGTQQTQPYLLSQFERPTLELTGVNTEVGVDTNADGKFDLLVVHAGIRVVVPGVYQYAARLKDPCGEQIEFISGQQSFPSGNDPESLVMTFDGSTIGAHGVGGPYAIRDLLVYGPGGSLVASVVTDTQTYTADQFTSFTGPPDCDGDGRPDLCEILAGQGTDCNANFNPDVCDVASGTSSDCNNDLIPDECQADCNANGVPDSCELIGFPYTLDDGTHELSLGAGSGDIIWLNQFNVVANGGTINTLSVAWGFGVAEGTPTRLLLYGDPNHDGDPADAILLASVVVNSSNADTDTLTSVAIPPTLVGNPGDSFFVGAYLTYASGYPASQDTSSAPAQRSWVAIADAGGIDYNNLALNPPFPIDAAGYPGNWLLRAQAAGSPHDCNANAVPDECDIASGSSHDVNGNGIPDECDAALPSGAVPDGGNVSGTPLTMHKLVNGDLALDWGGSCTAGDFDYGVYEGTLGAFTSHTPRLCSTAGGAAATLTPGAGSMYYLVVPRNVNREGSYGTTSSGAQRPPSVMACLPQMVGSCP